MSAPRRNKYRSQAVVALVAACVVLGFVTPSAAADSGLGTGQSVDRDAAGGPARGDTQSKQAAPRSPLDGRPLVEPGNGGVAGTGLGKITNDPEGQGQGMSVKGPAGQGVDSRAKPDIK
ncbi:hypothetical protein LGH83_11225 [Lichenihabitans sp. PAMC28606]|uniref:hypothetical protein n=1 Tax=Lichenihabitans sp. PAMC28606 TaxID=2880932 RepID=UPI001D0A196B|nr:hypothetical protein [Lichenihabitans sp. PAMC28606]UDL93184.1 hypothetical protein LGH83_11225 [Lichenihabitans sp. PAMC28606]